MFDSDIFAAAIVTFNPEGDFSKKLRMLSEACECVFHADNSAEPNCFNENLDNIFFLHNKNKGGLAGGLNWALKNARERGIRYLFLFDQDTEVPENYMHAMMQEITAYANSDVAIYGPMHTNTSTGHPVRLSVPKGFFRSLWPNSSMAPIPCYFIINSCTLLDLSKIPEEMQYSELLAVDMTDADFCLMARKKGIKTLCLPQISIAHGIGNKEKGSHKFSATNYSSTRKYLQAKNRMIVWKKYCFDFPGFVYSDILAFGFDVVRTLTKEEDKKRKCFALCKGLFDGFIQKTKNS